MLKQYVLKYRTPEDLEELKALEGPISAANKRVKEAGGVAFIDMTQEQKDTYNNAWKEWTALFRQENEIYRRAETRYIASFTGTKEEVRAAILKDAGEKIAALDEEEHKEMQRQFSDAIKTAEDYLKHFSHDDLLRQLKAVKSAPAWVNIVSFIFDLLIFQREALKVREVFDDHAAAFIAKAMVEKAHEWGAEIEDENTIKDYVRENKQDALTDIFGTDATDRGLYQERIEGKYNEQIDFPLDQTRPPEGSMLLPAGENYIISGLPAGYGYFNSLYMTGTGAPGKSGKKERTIQGSDGHRYKEIIHGCKGLEETVLLDMIRAYISKNNFYRQEDRELLNRTAELSFREVMGAFKKKDTPGNRKRFAQLLRDKHLPALDGSGLEIRGPEGAFVYIGIGAHKYGVYPQKDRIYIELRPEFVHAVNTAPQRPFYWKHLSQLVDTKNPLHYMLASYLSERYFSDKNRARNTHNILSIKSILRHFSDILPSFEEVEKTSRGHWPERIRQPLEKALNRIEEVSLFQWEYCHAGMKDCAPGEITSRKYEEWEKLYITYRFLPKEPDETGRLERKRKRIAAKAAAKEDGKDTKKGTVKTAKGYSKNRKRVQ